MVGRRDRTSTLSTPATSRRAAGSSTAAHGGPSRALLHCSGASPDKLKGVTRLCYQNGWHGQGMEVDCPHSAPGLEHHIRLVCPWLAVVPGVQLQALPCEQPAVMQLAGRDQPRGAGACWETSSMPGAGLCCAWGLQLGSWGAGSGEAASSLRRVHEPGAWVMRAADRVTHVHPLASEGTRPNRGIWASMQGMHLRPGQQGTQPWAFMRWKRERERES